MRIVYGAGCTWWDSIDKVKTTPSGLPCCPKCGGVLLEVENEEVWWSGAEDYERESVPGYKTFLVWSRGRCFRTFPESWAAYGLTAYRKAWQVVVDSLPMLAAGKVETVMQAIAEMDCSIEPIGKAIDQIQAR